MKTVYGLIANLYSIGLISASIMIDYRKPLSSDTDHVLKLDANETETETEVQGYGYWPSRHYKLIFEDNFNDFNMKTWKHDITLGGGGNWEFEYYSNNRSTSFVKNGRLHLRPILTSESLGEDAVKSGGTIDLWGNQPNMKCTANAFNGCIRKSDGENYLNPIQSALVRSYEKLTFTYGKVEVRARLPRGDWIWPAIWLLPADHNYGGWPVSGEIDLVESRGNDPSYSAQGRDTIGSALHWGPSWDYNRYQMTTKSYTLPNNRTFNDNFHTFTLEWTPEYIKTFVDNNVVLSVKHNKSYWNRGKFPSNFNNPWQGRPNSAPFDREFYLIFNVAVGGTGGYFPEGAGNKPWSNTSPTAAKEFYEKKDEWYSTWPKDDRRDLIIDYVKVYSLN